MAKVLIVGSNARSYKDKKTGEMHNLLTLCVVKTNANFNGKCTEEVVVNDNQPLYGNLVKFVRGSVGDFVGYFANLDRDNRGYLENFELTDKSSKAIDWGF